MHIVGTWELGTLIYLISCHEKTNSTPVHWPINGRNRRLSGLPPYGDMLPYYHVAPCSWTLKTRLPLEADSRDNTWPHACGHSGLTCHSRPPKPLRAHLPAKASSGVSTWLFTRDRAQNPPPRRGRLRCSHVALCPWSIRTCLPADVQDPLLCRGKLQSLHVALCSWLLRTRLPTEVDLSADAWSLGSHPP
jgi:hypothetical protein